MMHSFPNIRNGLIIDIARGVSSARHDICIDDIVVSAPRNGEWGAFQFEFGKELQGQDFQATKFLDQPPVLLQTAVATLRTRYEGCGHQLKESIRDALKRESRLRQIYGRLDLDTDRLYRSTIVHPLSNEKGCIEPVVAISPTLSYVRLEWRTMTILLFIMD